MREALAQQRQLSDSHLVLFRISCFLFWREERENDWGPTSQRNDRCRWQQRVHQLRRNSCSGAKIIRKSCITTDIFHNEAKRKREQRLLRESHFGFSTFSSLAWMCSPPVLFSKRRKRIRKDVAAKYHMYKTKIIASVAHDLLFGRENIFWNCTKTSLAWSQKENSDSTATTERVALCFVRFYPWWHLQCKKPSRENKATTLCTYIRYDAR